MAEVRRRIVFHGHVQGVGFRHRAKSIARPLRLTGWVKNEADGTVLMEVQGHEMLINTLLAGLNNDQYIRIEWLDIEEIPLGSETGFDAR